MKTFLSYISILFVLCTLVAIPSSFVHAKTTYTMTDVASHNSASDCWMVINNTVYNLTTYLPDHDKELNIRSWCGKDATEDYNTKNGKGKNHSVKADTLLEEYSIGTIVIGTEQTDPIVTVAPSQTTKSVSASAYKSPYNILVPFLGTIILYLVSLKLLQKQLHSAIWNSILLLGIIPSFFFGVGMVLAQQFPSLRLFSSANLLYYHVELSIIFGTTCILHFLFRLQIYFAQMKPRSTV